MSKILFKKTLIIGLGLIGGSFAKALRQHKISQEIFAYDSNIEAIDLAKNDQAIDGGSDNISLLDDDFDFIVIATPISTYEEIFPEISAKISSETLVIDLGSLKNFISEILPKNLSANFVACHPIAGSEKNGFENSSGELFRDKKFIICKSQKNSEILIKKVENLAKIIGSNVEFIDAKAHDEIYALVSHLPQFLSFLTAEFSPKKIADEFFKTAFRLDNSDPEIWSDIFALNQENLEKFYLEFFDNLEKNIELYTARPRHEDGVTKPLLLSVALEDDLSPRRMTGSIDEKFFEENFAAIFFRALIVVSYLQIPQIKTFQKYAGSGFADFTSIVVIFNYEQEKLIILIKKNQQKILKLFEAIS